MENDKVECISERPPVQPEDIESRIRDLVLSKRIRVGEYFGDFDKFNIGYITASQFLRCLDQTVGVRLTPEETNILLDKYDLKCNGTINYRHFIEVIDKNFNPNIIKTNPKLQTVEAPEYLGTTSCPTDPDILKCLDHTMKQLCTYYKYHGISLLSIFQNFDKQNTGLITDNQFQRALPRPLGFPEEVVKLLINQYRSPEKPEFVNYLNFNNDITDRIKAMDKEKPHKREIPYGYWPPQSAVPPELHEVFNRIRKAVYIKGIRTPEFFKDYDKLHSGLITEGQFVRGLILACGKEAKVTEDDIETLLKCYRAGDGMVRYQDFCDVMENAFNIPYLEKHPTAEVYRPERGALSEIGAKLTDEEELQVARVLSEFAKIVNKRQLLVNPFFKDFDKRVAYKRILTKSQFARTLDYLGLGVLPLDLRLLCKKFEDPVTGDVNYVAFSQAIDRDYTGFKVDCDEPVVDMSTDVIPEPIVQEKTVDLDELIARMRHDILINRKRTVDFIEDFDSLRRGRITTSVFRRVLSMMGFDPQLTEAQFKVLAECYTDPLMPDHILWHKFSKDMDLVFTIPELEKKPKLKLPPQENFQLPKVGATDADDLEPQQRELFEATMCRIKQRIGHRNLLTYPDFADFDKFHHGHVTSNQFRRCLSQLGLQATEDEMDVIEKVFSDEMGVNYVKFLEEVDPRQKPERRYEKLMSEIHKLNAAKKNLEVGASTDIACILEKIKTKVYRERMRLDEHMKDFDKLHSGRILKINFRRALDLNKFELQPSEVAILEKRYESCNKPDYVDYKVLFDDIESIFTLKDLEKFPLAEVSQFKPPEDWTLNELSTEDEIAYLEAVARLADKVKKKQLQLFPFFEDYDTLHIGRISQSQFHRVLTELDLDSVLSLKDIRAIRQKFQVKVGSRDDVDYIAFCDAVYDAACIDKRMP